MKMKQDENENCIKDNNYKPENRFSPGFHNYRGVLIIMITRSELQRLDCYRDYNRWKIMWVSFSGIERSSYSQAWIRLSQMKREYGSFY